VPLFTPADAHRQMHDRTAEFASIVASRAARPGVWRQLSTALTRPPPGRRAALVAIHEAAALSESRDPARAAAARRALVNLVARHGGNMTADARAHVAVLERLATRPLHGLSRVLEQITALIAAQGETIERLDAGVQSIQRSAAGAWWTLAEHSERLGGCCRLSSRARFRFFAFCIAALLLWTLLAL
jgi:hypothetical protein